LTQTPIKRQSLAISASLKAPLNSAAPPPQTPEPKIDVLDRSLEKHRANVSGRASRQSIKLSRHPGENLEIEEYEDIRKFLEDRHV
jgi:hypothetical protein